MTVQQAIEAAQQALHAGNWPEAQKIYQELLRVVPNVAEFHVNLGNVQQAQGQYEQALANYAKAIALKPTLIDAHYNQGIVHNKMGNLADAVVSFGNVLELNPDDADARIILAASLNNVGSEIYQAGRLDEAIQAFRGAITLHSDFPVAHHNLGWALLLKGDFANGWSEYEWRGRTPELGKPYATFPQPRWDGSDLQGRRIFLHAEQGFGDTIQFIRYASGVAQKGGEIIVGCPPELVRLVRGLPYIKQVKTDGDPVPEFDVHSPLMSLPMAFGTTLETIPATVPYILADPDLSSKWHSRLAGKKTKVGLAWAGRETNANDRNRSLSPDLLNALASVPDISWISLQKGATQSPTGLQLSDWTAELSDFADTAALIDNLDLVISVDTAVAHLAGAMGKPVWMLLPFVPDWRWMLNRTDSPWYPTMRLFRQPSLGAWKPAIQQVADELNKLAAAPRPISR